MAAKSRRGFASMDPEQQRAIASLGGQVSHAKGKAREFTREEAIHAGKIGGWVTSRDRQHMSRLGIKGGTAKARKRRLEKEQAEKGKEYKG